MVFSGILFGVMQPSLTELDHPRPKWNIIHFQIFIVEKRSFVLSYYSTVRRVNIPSDPKIFLTKDLSTVFCPR